MDTVVSFPNKYSLRGWRLGFAAILFVLFPSFAYGAKYQGQNVNGRRFCGYARSLQTGKYYPATVVFNNDHVNVRLNSGLKIELTLDKPNVDDPEEVLATDSAGQWWSLSIDGLDELANGSKNATSESETTTL